MSRRCGWNRAFVAAPMLALMALSTSCGSGGGGTDFVVPPNAVLELVTPGSITLGYGETATITAQYVNESGGARIAVQNAPLTFTIEGAGIASTISTANAVTDNMGQASVVVTSGSTDESFIVRITPPAPTEGRVVSVGVSGVPAGAISTELTYSGTQQLSTTRLSLYQGRRCTDLPSDALPAGAIAMETAPRFSDGTGFTPVAAGSDYAIAVIAELSGGAGDGAFGCRDGIAVSAGSTTPVTIPLSDLGDANAVIEGRYALANTFNLLSFFDDDSSGDSLIEQTVGAIEEFNDDEDLNDGRPGGDPSGGRGYGEDPGAFVADLIIRQNCAWPCPTTSGDVSSCLDTQTPEMQRLHRLGDMEWWYRNSSRIITATGPFGNGEVSAPGQPTYEVHGNGGALVGCNIWWTGWGDERLAIFQRLQQEVNRLVAANLGQTFDEVTQTLSDVARELRAVQLSSTLDLSNDARVMHTLGEFSFSARINGTEQTFSSPNLATVGFSTDPVTVQASISNGILTVPEHSFSFDSGAFLFWLLDDVVLQQALGYQDGLISLINGILDCTQLTSALGAAIGLESTSIIAPEDLDIVCQTALDFAVTNLQAFLRTGLVEGFQNFSIAGTATAADPDPSNGRARVLQNGSWIGDIGGSNVSGTFTGTLQQ